jgi:hypothetical protein
MYKIDQIEEELANGSTEKARKAEWQKNTGQMFLMHLDSVGQPHSKLTLFSLDILPQARSSRSLTVFKRERRCTFGLRKQALAGFSVMMRNANHF